MSAQAIKAIDINNYKLTKGIFYIEVGDYYFEEYALNYFRNLVEEQAQAFDLIELAQPTFAEIAERLRQYSLFGGNIVIIVKDFSTKLENTERQELAQFAENIPDGYFLIFSSSKGLIGADKALMQPIMASKGTQYELTSLIKKLYPNALESGAIAKLIDYTAGDMVRISTEIKKLIDYAGDRVIKIQDIEEMVAPNMEYKMYEFTNAMALRQHLKALDIMDSMLASGLGVGLLLRALITQYQRMFYAKVSKLSEEALASKLKIKPYAVFKTKEATARYSPLQLMNILTMLKEKEQDYRIGKTSEKQAFASALSHLSAN